MVCAGGPSVPRQGFDLVGLEGGTARGHEKGVAPQEPVLIERAAVCSARGE